MVRKTKAKTKPRKKVIKAKTRLQPGDVAYRKIPPLSRVDWADEALESRRNAIDYGKKAKTRYPPTIENYDAWARGGRERYDLEGHDHPRKDVKKIPKTYYKYAGAPPKRLRATTKTAEKVLRKNFTAKERKDIGKVIIEGVSPSKKSWAGQNTHDPATNVSVIEIAPIYTGDEDVYTHELVHARRQGSGEECIRRDLNKEETQTEFETVGRISAPKKKLAGYYQFIKGGNEKEDIKHDRILLTGSMDKKRKGKRFMADVKKKYKDSRIKDAHFSPAENLDRYFQVILPNKKRIEIHRRYKPKIRDSKAKILKEFKSKYGKGITAYEWENGKRVKMGGTIKRRTAVSKTKKAPKRKNTVKKTTARSKKPIKKVSVKKRTAQKRKTTTRKR
jgi:hypothetical protein